MYFPKLSDTRGFGLNPTNFKGLDAKGIYIYTIFFFVLYHLISCYILLPVLYGIPHNIYSHRILQVWSPMILKLPTEPSQLPCSREIHKPNQPFRGGFLEQRCLRQSTYRCLGSWGGKAEAIDASSWQGCSNRKWLVQRECLESESRWGKMGMWQQPTAPPIEIMAVALWWDFG